MYVGIVYCSAAASTAGREIETIADGEVFEVAQAVKTALEKEGHRAELLDLRGTSMEDLSRCQWIFNLAETIDGFPFKDYEIASQMENLNIPFTGSGSGTLYACADKARAKYELGRVGLLTPVFEIFPEGAPARTGLFFPLIVKPIHEDGSIGIFADSIVWEAGALARKLDGIHQRYCQPAIVEEYIEGRDISISILGNGEQASVLPPSECVYLNGFEGPHIITYEAKWVEESNAYRHTRTVCPCDLDESLQLELQGLALRAYQALHCRDYARVDLRLRDRTAYILEINPNPCINPHDASFTLAGQAGGYAYDRLVNEILNGSLCNRVSTSQTVSLEWSYGQYALEKFGAK